MTDTNIERTLLVLRLVLLAMGAGIIAFAGIAIFLVTGGHVTTRPDVASLLLPGLGLVAATALVAYVLVRRALLATLRRLPQTPQTQDAVRRRLVSGFMLLTIAGGAMAEAPSLVGAIIFMQSGHWAALLAPLLGVGALVLLFPSRDKFERLAAQVTGQYGP
jgi:hypothetical protein